MNGVVFAYAMRSGGRGLAWYALALVAILASGALGYDAVAQQGESLREIVRGLPPALKSALQLAPDSLTSRVGYVNARSLSLLWPVMIIALSAGSAAAIAGMIERGSIHYELSLPTPRTRWLASRAGASVVTLLAVVVLSWAGLQLLVPGVAWWRFAVPGFAFGFLWLGLSYALTSWLSDRSAVMGAVFVVFAVQFVLATVASALPDAWGWLEHFTIWSEYRPEETVRSGVPLQTVGAWLGLGALGFALSLWRWSQRDLPA